MTSGTQGRIDFTMTLNRQSMTEFAMLVFPAQVIVAVDLGLTVAFT